MKTQDIFEDKDKVFLKIDRNSTSFSFLVSLFDQTLKLQCFQINITFIFCNLVYSRPLFLYFLSFKYSWYKTKFANGWIRTSDLGCRKRPLFQMSHNHLPYNSKGYITYWATIIAHIILNQILPRYLATITVHIILK